MKRISEFRPSLVQSCWTIAGIILTFSGLLALKTPNEEVVSIAAYLGVSMLAAGSLNLFVCLKKFNTLDGSRWLFADSLATILLSLFPIFNEIILPAMIPFFFGAWEIFSGIVKIIDSKELHDEKIKGWQSFSIIGGIEILSGTSAMIEPVDDFIGMHLVITMVFLVQAASFFIKAFMYKRLLITNQLK